MVTWDGPFIANKTKTANMSGSVRMDELLLILPKSYFCPFLFPKSHNGAPKVLETDSAHKQQCKLSITSTKKKKKTPRLQRCGFSCDSSSDENKLKENMSWR